MLLFIAKLCLCCFSRPCPHELKSPHSWLIEVLHESVIQAYLSFFRSIFIEAFFRDLHTGLEPLLR
jgi:hypothetical protein